MHLVSLLALTILAQVPPVVPKAPEVGYISPPGGKAGTTVNVQLAGFDWTPDLQFFFSDQRIKLELLGPPGPILVAPPPRPGRTSSYRPRPIVRRRACVRPG